MKYIYIDIAISIVFFYNIQARGCGTYLLKWECYSKPCSCCSSGRWWYDSQICNECCKKNGIRFCVRDIHYHRCEPANTTSDRPYTTQTPLNKTDQYSANSSSKHSLGGGVYFVFVIMAASLFFLFTTIVYVSRRCRRKLLRHERRNVPYTSPNVQTSSNDGSVQQNPIYNIGDEETTIPADLPPVYSIGSYNCAQYVSNYDAQNDPPPVYTNDSFNCAQNVANGDVQNDAPPVYTNCSFNCAQNMINGDLQNDPPPVYTNGSYSCAQNVTNGDLQNDPPPVYTNGCYNCTQNVTNGDLRNDPPYVYSIGHYSCTINVTNR